MMRYSVWRTERKLAGRWPPVWVMVPSLLSIGLTAILALPFIILVAIYEEITS